MRMQQNQMSPRQMAEGRYKSARLDLLIVIIFTVFNIVMLFTGSETMMLFSATIPYYAVAIAYFTNLQLGGLEWFVTGSLIFAFVILAMYLVCWFFSKKRNGWLIAALVLFCLDTVATVFLYLGALGEGIMDFLIHGIVIWYLAMGVKAGKQLKTLPEDVVEVEGGAAVENVPLENSAPLRWADPELKHRVLLEAECQGMRICYRRVKQPVDGHWQVKRNGLNWRANYIKSKMLNELVINGYVYAEVEMVIGPSHELTAVFNGHKVVAGFNSLTAKSYILVDDQKVAEKVRLV